MSEEPIVDDVPPATLDEPPRPPAKNSVQYETYDRVMRKLKKAEEEADALRIEKQKRAQDDVERDGDLSKKIDYYKTQSDERDQELLNLRSQIDDHAKEKLNDDKRSLVLDAIQGSVDRAFWIHIDLDEVSVNPDTGEVDPSSVERVATAFTKKFGSRLIDTPAANNMAANSANLRNGSTKLTMDAWKQLPYKERQARIGDIEGVRN